MDIDERHLSAAVFGSQERNAMVVVQVTALEDLYLPFEDDEHIVGRSALAEQRLSRRNPSRFESLREVLQNLVAERAEKADFAQLVHGRLGIGATPLRSRFYAHRDLSVARGSTFERPGPMIDRIRLDGAEILRENDAPATRTGIVVHLTCIPSESEVEGLAPVVA